MKGFDLNETTNPKTFEKNVEAEMDKHIKHFEKELVKIRTGRAHTSLLEDIKVACYGTVMPLRDVAALSAPDVSLLVVQPFDVSIMSDIEKAISNSDLGVTPANDGTIIRIALPRMSTTRRDELTKVLGKKLEECKIALRNVRKDIVNLIRDTEKTKKVSEDLSRRLQDSLQKVTDKFTAQADVLSTKKEEEIRHL
jgi:ribosome recycling factor